jgi:hypothetical protein
MSNLDGLLYLKPKKDFILVIFILVLIIGIVIITALKTTYDVYNYTGYISCEDDCFLKINCNITDIERINKGKIIKINNQKLSYKIKVIGEAEIDYLTMTNFQTITVETKLDKDLKKNNLSVQSKIYENKEKLGKKIIKKFI